MPLDLPPLARPGVFFSYYRMSLGEAQKLLFAVFFALFSKVGNCQLQYIAQDLHSFYGKLRDVREEGYYFGSFN